MPLGVPKHSLREAVAANVVRLLRKEREQRGLSMNVLAQRAGLSHSMVSLVERDLRNPSLDVLLRLAEVLRIDLGKLIMRASKAAARKSKRRSK